MALKVDLKPHEKIIIGSWVITNTDQRARLLIEGERTLRVQDLYHKVLAAVGRLAQREGYDLVLQNDTQDFRPENQQQLMAMILGRKVLHVNSKLDVSDALIQMLNNEYVNRAQAAPRQ